MTVTETVYKRVRCLTSFPSHKWFCLEIFSGRTGGWFQGGCVCQSFQTSPMALTGELEVDLELQSPADKVFNVLRNEAHRLPALSPDKLHAVELHEGDWHVEGSVKLWTFTVDGKIETLKEQVLMDDENKSILFVGVEGDLFKQYSSYRAAVQISPKGEASLAKILVEYERLKEDAPPPTKYFEIVANVVKDIDAHLVKA